MFFLYFYSSVKFTSEQRYLRSIVLNSINDDALLVVI
ncbi:MAG: hypothetical protein SCAL_000636 [Candidatus Syntrophoarchaeum caldarius]|uniref:Uncharacterized protein n=1 Tax=Candidatus Syntropharchaeum caldarium TaxID=1838285 RepID=A0A1F2PBI2_9EURY|nr:MAG: hypothetical protein SCAL_000636 [Candidatus Syntrophoarchaeum caldarius]